MPNKLRQFLAAVSVSLLGAASAAPAFSANHSNVVPAWSIKQNSYNLGDVDIILAKDGFRWHNDKLGLTLLMRAPDWKLSAYNESNKKYLTLNKDEALEIFQHQRRQEHCGLQTPFKLGDKPAVAGMPTIGYCWSRDRGNISDDFALSITNSFEKGTKLTSEQKKYVDGALKHQRREYWLSKDIVISPRISEVFLEKVAATKYSDAMPLRLIQVAKDGTKTTMFDTKEVKKMAVSMDTFKLPSGYTKAENKIALLVNDQEFGFDAEPDLAAALSPKDYRKNESVRR
ncbi:MAG TPA: hypothetical protein V6C76_12500 [Drouetiella sp.]